MTRDALVSYNLSQRSKSSSNFNASHFLQFIWLFVVHSILQAFFLSILSILSLSFVRNSFPAPCFECVKYIPFLK